MTNTTTTINKQEQTSEKILSGTREVLIEEFLNVISDESFEIKWNKMFNSVLPVNGKTGREYNGVNVMLINALALRGEFEDDNRFYTFKQANELGYRVKKGSKSIPIEHSMMYKYNKESNKYNIPINYKEYNELSVEEKINVRRYSQTFRVFNAKNLDGVNENKHMDKYMNNLSEDKETQQVLNTMEKVISEMGIKINRNVLADVPHYNPVNNEIVMPDKRQFDNYVSYIGVLLHELIHTTGQESMFNRESLHKYNDDIKYRAEEELIAEIGSSLILQKLNIGVDLTESRENAKAYVKSWGKLIKDDDKFLLRAIREAEKSSTNVVKRYMSLEQNQKQEKVIEPIEKIEEKETKKVKEVKDKQAKKEKIATYDKKQIPYKNIHSEKLRNISIIDYCRGAGIDLTKVGGEYRIKGMDSLAINENSNIFYRHSTGAGGGIIDFVMEYHEMDFKSALNELNSFSGGMGEVYINDRIVKTREKKEVIKEEKELELPKMKNGKYSNLYAYLCGKRGINGEIVGDLIVGGQLYQDTKYNIVFVSYDENKSPVYGFKRSTGDKFQFKGDCKGSDKSVSFFMSNKESKDLFVTESIIDSLSIATLLKENDREYKEYNYLSLGGTSTKSLDNFLSKNDIYRVYIATDNDVPGLKAREDIKEMLSKKYPHIICVDKISKGKDFNEDLVKIKETQKEIAKKRKREIINACIIR